MTASAIYRKKTVELEADPYAVRVELEEGYKGPIPLSGRWEEAWSPYLTAIKKLEGISGAPRGVIIAKVEQAKKELTKMLPNVALAIAHAAQAVMICKDMPGMTREKCISIIADATGLSKALIEEALRGAGGGGGGGVGGGGGGGGQVT